MSMVTTYLTYPNLFQFWDAQQGCTTVWTPSTWCLNTKHVMGWKRESLIRAIQMPCPNQLFILFQHFAAYYTMVILCWRSTGRINRHFTMVYHLWQPRSQCFENPLKTNVGLLFGGCFCSTDGQQVFLGSSTHNAQVQRQLRPLSRATKTSVFFMTPIQLWCLGQGRRGCTRSSSCKKIWRARIN